MHQGYKLVCACIYLFSIAPAPASAALPIDYSDGFVRHQVIVPRIETPGDLHTDLTRSPWDKATLLTGNLDWRRIRTADVPIRTYVFYDHDALYFGYRSEVKPGKDLKVAVRERDQDMKKDDNFTLELDVGPTGRILYRFVINPAGNLTDSVIIDKTWNSHAAIKTATDEKGWTGVVRIPFSDFGRAEPAPGTFWTFNLSTRAGIDNCWAPVLGGYHEPEQFSRLVFGGQEAKPVRLVEFKPLHLGSNALRVQAPAGTRCLVEAIDGQGQAVHRQEDAVAQDGQVSFQLLDEQIDHVNFTFKDSTGKEVLTFWRPAEIPEILGRLPALREKVNVIVQNTGRFPESVWADVKRLVTDTEAFLNSPIQSVQKDWTGLHEKLGKLERQVTDAWLYAQTLERLSPKAAFAVALATPMDKVMIKDFPCPGRTASEYDLYLARNEHEAVQVVVIPMTGPLKKVTVTASPAIGRNDQGPLAGRISPAVVGHVQTKFAGSYLPDYVGWYPDPILDFQQSCDAGPGEHVAFWVDVEADEKARPGDYESTVTVSAENCDPVRIRLSIHVWDIELPEGSHLRNAFTCTESNTKRLYKDRWTKELARRYNDFILDHRLNIDSLYGKQDRDIEVLRHGASRGMNAFNLFYVGKGADAGVVRKLLEERMPPLKEAGLDKLAYLYGFDEVNDEVFPKIKEIFGMVHSLYPGLPTMTTGYDNTFGRTTGLRDYVDIWVPLIPRYNMLEAQRLRAEGKEMWWYLCVGPRHPYPNWFVESPSIEARLLMGAMSYKYQIGGVLYFMTNNWSLNDRPVSAGPYTDWFPGSGKSRDGVYANGDGSIFCPGPEGPLSTMRFENIRDGLEDYEYLWKLSKVVEAVAGQPASIQRAEFLQYARELLSIPQQVVESSSRYTYGPDQLYAFRRSVAEAIIRGLSLGGGVPKQ